MKVSIDQAKPPLLTENELQPGKFYVSSGNLDYLYVKVGEYLISYPLKYYGNPCPQKITYNSAIFSLFTGKITIEQ